MAPPEQGSASFGHVDDAEAGSGSSDVTDQTPRREGVSPGEKSGQIAHSDVSLDADSPIWYFDLAFDTILPTLPVLENQAPSLHQRLPSAPDLTRLGSPLKWSPARKSLLLALSCIATFLTAYTAGSYSPPATAIANDFGTRRLVVLVGITTFCLGFALAPMALAPISEIWGRFPVFAAAGVVFVVFQAACSVTRTVTGLLIARFLVGVGASVFSAVVGGVIADLWDKQDRNTPMALFSGAVLVGTGAGPLVATALVHAIGDSTLAWKWTFWHQAILDGVLVLAIFLLCKESRAPVLLARRAQLLNKWYDELESRGSYGLQISDPKMEAVVDAAVSSDSVPGRQNELSLGKSRSRQLLRVRWLVGGNQQRIPFLTLISISVQRPFHMLLTEPIVFCFSLWAAFSWGVLYLSFSVVPFLYQNDVRRASRVYVAMMVAAAISTAVSIAQQQLLQHPQWRAHAGGFQYADSPFWALMRKRLPPESPEARLYFACLTTLCLPAGLFGAFLGARAEDGRAEAIGLGFATAGIYSVYLATFNYLADSYGTYASSALAAQNFCRNVLGGSFPLITGVLFSNLGLRGAGGLLGAIATVLTATPWVLVFYGETIRARSKFAVSLRQ
ncbi:hypothetical protein HIM_05321 [Hirsutella minnesotensis 3608]|uniref:Major facilitator superfamily (MFS) profile domain-containing protein n=1 Tax=Hirsutella minnesotensis 3608 TaxID=1043627 RepID=A0A0F7ZPF2_9HYPO|nr:hypothetical protein HIM_05321 [Hirsutella minnesotensis 3608]